MRVSGLEPGEITVCVSQIGDSKGSMRVLIAKVTSPHGEDLLKERYGFGLGGDVSNAAAVTERGRAGGPPRRRPIVAPISTRRPDRVIARMSGVVEESLPKADRSDNS